MQPKKTLLSWSGGKDSAWALHTLRQNPAYQVAALLTTVNERFRRVAIHGFREELLDLQAVSVGLPIWKIPLPYPCSNEDYESRMQAVCARAVKEGFEAVAFGDLFLEDIRAYRIEHLAGTGLEPVFPIWEFRRINWRKPWSLPDCGPALRASTRVNCPLHFVDAFSMLTF